MKIKEIAAYIGSKDDPMVRIFNIKEALKDFKKYLNPSLMTNLTWTFTGFKSDVGLYYYNSTITFKIGYHSYQVKDDLRFPALLTSNKVNLSFCYTTKSEDVPHQDKDYSIEIPLSEYGSYIQFIRENFDN